MNDKIVLKVLRIKKIINVEKYFNESTLTILEAAIKYMHLNYISVPICFSTKCHIVVDVFEHVCVILNKWLGILKMNVLCLECLLRQHVFSVNKMGVN